MKTCYIIVIVPLGSSWPHLVVKVGPVQSWLNIKLVWAQPNYKLQWTAVGNYAVKIQTLYLQYVFQKYLLILFCLSTEDQHSKWWWEALLLPPLHLCCRHREHPARLQWLSRHHPADAPATVRAVVMRKERCLAKNTKTLWTMENPEPRVPELPSSTDMCERPRAKPHTHITQNILSCKLHPCSRQSYFNGRAWRDNT